MIHVKRAHIFKKWCIMLFFFGCLQPVGAQTIKGNLKEHALQKVSLFGFNYNNRYELSNTILDSLGNFTLKYPESYRGVAVLKAQDKSDFVLILEEDFIEIQGEHLKKTNTIFFKKNSINALFSGLASSYRSRTQVYGAWRYLDKKYGSSKELKQENEALKAIRAEIHRLEEKDKNQLTNLPHASYLKWYMPKRKLLSDMPESIHKYNERIPQNIEQFRSIDFNNENFRTSSLYKELIEGHYFLLENMGLVPEHMYAVMNNSTDYLIENLKENNTLLNMVSKELFLLFEKRSLFSAAAYLSKRLLNDASYKIEDEFSMKMQKYVALKVGNIAPDIQLDEQGKLSDLKKNVLLIFGASTCPYCINKLQELKSMYSSWKNKLEVVYISLDLVKHEYEKTYESMPWKTYCDYKGWETKAAKDYFVLATPTYVLLDKNMKILLHPSSLKQVNVWVDYKL